jgi:dTDP-4-amino-4,6-dideoxygalactose transaminase
MSAPVKTRVPFLDLQAQYRSIKEEIQTTLEQVLEAASFIGGEWVERFEEEFARFVGARFAVGVSSGTSALELALKSLRLGPGDEVIVPANSFFATAEAVSNVGARPVFADVQLATFHLDVNSVERALTPKTRAIIPVHLYGRAMDMTAVEALATAHRLHIIEDGAQAHGCTRAGARVGGSGRLTCFSFYPGKNLGAYGDAGMVTTNDPQQAAAIRLLRDHGSAVKYVHSVIGTNARLDAMQAAVLSVKLRHLLEWNGMRQKHAAALAAALATSDVVVPEVPPPGEHVFHLFVVRSPERDALRKYLQAEGIGTGIHYPVPLHLTTAYQDLGYPGKGSLPVAERLAGEVLSLPMYPELSAEHIASVTSAVRTFRARRSERTAGVGYPAAH